MPYTPDPTDPTQPADSGVAASTAAAEFRALKTYIKKTEIFAYGNSHDNGTTGLILTSGTVVEVIDRKGEFAAGVFTCTRAGSYEIEASAVFKAVGAGGVNSLVPTVNGVAPYDGGLTFFSQTLAQPTKHTVRYVWNLVIGDVVSVNIQLSNTTWSYASLRVKEL